MITIHKLPEVLETYFLDEGRTTPSPYWGCALKEPGFLGPELVRRVGEGTMAGWALTVSCPQGGNLASFAALQYMLDNATQGRWVMVVVPREAEEPSQAAIWSYMHSAMAWEVGFVGAVVWGWVRDTDEIRLKLGKEFNVFARGGSPVAAMGDPEGEIGAPVVLNGVTVRTGDMIVGDSDGVVCIPKQKVVDSAERCRLDIVEDVNMLQHVREGMGAMDVLGLRDMLKDQIEIVG